MLTIGKIGGTGKGHWRTPAYYTHQVAQGAEDYYSGKGEAQGSWVGRGAAQLGLVDQLQDGDLHALFERRHPTAGDQLGRPPGVDSVKGIDVQMAVPKSVSTLWALAEDYGRPEVAASVWEATHGAGRAALDYLERHACTSRAGKGGHVRLKGEGFIGAAFPHRFSRAGDPHVHVHFLIANMTRCGDPDRGVPDGWRALDARDIYRHQLAAGYVFQAELRERLTHDLGVEWSEVHKGAAEIVGVPRELSVELSQRRAQIIDALGGRTGTAREAEIAALSTRKGKREIDLAEQRTHWRAVAEEHGFGVAEFADTIGRAGFRDLDRQEIATTVEDLIGPTGLTRERSTFTRRDIVQSLAAAHGRGGSVGRIEELADRLIASDQIVAVDGPADTTARLRGRSAGDRIEGLFTTAEMLDLEARMVDQAAARVGEGIGAVRPASVEGGGFARRPGGLVLSDEQQQMVRQLVTSGHGIDLVRARAGTGKTTAIDAARELWERDDYRVIGGALAGRAADELCARGGIDSYTIHGLLHDLDRGGDYAFADRTVLVIDEAGMVGSRQLSRLLDHAAQANAKVVLIGDERQLAAVDAGGGFKALADRLGAIELTEVYRQHHAWDRAALDQLRHGDISQWIAAYDRHGRLIPTQSADDQLQQLVSDWYVATREHGLIETQMFATTREDAQALNQLGRAARVAAGELDDTAALTIGDRQFTHGDRVLALRNEWVDATGSPVKHRLRNGNRGTVTAIDRDAGALQIRLDHGPEIVLTNDYLTAGQLSHGYAQTIHKSQGMTITQDFVLASPDLAREARLRRRQPPHRQLPLLHQRRPRPRPRPTPAPRPRRRAPLPGPRTRTRHRARQTTRRRRHRDRRRPRRADHRPADRDPRPRPTRPLHDPAPRTPRTRRRTPRARRIQRRPPRRTTRQRPRRTRRPHHQPPRPPTPRHPRTTHPTPRPSTPRSPGRGHRTHRRRRSIRPSPRHRRSRDGDSRRRSSRARASRPSCRRALAGNEDGCARRRPCDRARTRRTPRSPHRPRAMGASSGRPRVLPPPIRRPTS